MEITSNQIYNSIMHGAYSVIKNKEVLNKINVFPVRDGDTGSNLSSTMQTIIRESKDEGCVKKTLESIADAALFGARGNSGIIFAQYLNGLSESVTDDQKISVKAYARASSLAVSYACEAIEEPVEGTMITVMREWGDALASESLNKRSLVEIFRNAYSAIEEALE
jgi:dihydroxyacetone kinase-like predicted kinase